MVLYPTNNLHLPDQAGKLQLRALGGPPFAEASARQAIQAGKRQVVLHK
jgi:hypothetical protein